MTLTLIATAAALSACTLFEPVPTIDLANSYSIIDGDTVKTRVEKDFKEYKKNDPNARNFIIVGDTVLTYKAPKLHTPPAKAPDLSKLKNNDDPDLKGKPLRMVAIGGSLTAGVRDGGYFNEGMLTSYPNLIARQMGIKFEQPLFDADSYNGFGRKVRTSFNPTGGPVPKFKEVSNNSGVESITEVVGADDKTKTQIINLKKIKNSKDLDNWGVPNLRKETLYLGSKIENIDWNSNAKMNKSYFTRIANDTKISYLKHSFNKKGDLLLSEVGWSEIISVLKNEKISNAYPNLSLNEYWEFPVEKLLTDIGATPEMLFFKLTSVNKYRSGVILNIPNIYKFPAFNIIKKAEIDKVVKMANLDILYIAGGVQQLIYTNSLSATPEVDSLLSPKVHIALKKGLNPKNPLGNTSLEANSDGSSKLVISYNNDLAFYAKKLNFPVVDINSLYERIMKGGFITDDGVKIDPSFPTGNFFSNDGIYPTALGQAVIANEVIKVLNAHYKMQIPAVPTKEYLLK